MLTTVLCHPHRLLLANNAWYSIEGSSGAVNQLRQQVGQRRGVAGENRFGRIDEAATKPRQRTRASPFATSSQPNGERATKTVRN